MRLALTLASRNLFHDRLRFFATLVGSRLYPQRYVQFPVDILFFPLGVILGWMAGATARLVRPPISIAAMLGVVALSTIVYGSFTFQFARSNAVPARLSVPGWGVRAAEMVLGWLGRAFDPVTVVAWKDARCLVHAGFPAAFRVGLA